MANPSLVPGIAGQAMVPGSSGQMHPRMPRPSSQTGSGLIFFFVQQIIQF